MSCFLDSLVSKVIDVVCDKAIVPVGRQFKYVFCYKSNIANMKAVDHGLEKKQNIVEESVKEASNNLRVISEEAKEWLQEVDKAHEEVRSLFNTYEQDQATRWSCCIGGQILNPIARHQLGRKATKKKQTIEQLLLKKPKPDEISSAPPPPGVVDHEATSSGASEQQTEGVFRSSRWEEIMEEIMMALKDERTNVIGLHGMGGVGKSTLIKVVHDQVKKQGLFDEVARVAVKVKPEIRRIQQEIAFALGLKFENEWSLAIRGNLLRERLLLKTNPDQHKKSVLIILDDLWEKLDIQEVGIPLSENNQVHIKLFLTSRHEYLLSDKMGARDPIRLDVLGHADALRMFKFFVGVAAEGVKVDKVSEIARKCSGLPIVIEATAKALKGRALGEWDKILERLDNVDVLEKLKVSYDYLPSKESKYLFLICGIIRGPHIQVRDLLKYTFGLQLYNRKDCSTLVACAARLEKLLSGLEAASMLLKSDDNRYVKIHDCMREVALRIVEEDFPEWAYDVTLSDNNCELSNASELKLLLSYCEGDAVELQDSFLKDMEKLNVLEFTNWHCGLSSVLALKAQLVHLRNLGTLCLHNCSLDDISMIVELKGLQILCFRGSGISKLPIQLRGLIALKMLDLSDCTKLTLIEPNVLGSLTNLEELNMENSFKDWEIVGEDAPPINARLTELKNLTRLTNVRIHIPHTSMLPKDGQLFSSKLIMYRIMFGVAKRDGWQGKSVEDKDVYCKFSDEYNKFSRVLMLTFDSPDIVWHDWIQTTLQTAEVLYLSGRLDEKCKSSNKMCIKGFDCLKHLRIRKCPSFSSIISSHDGFSTNLETLYLENLESLEKLCGEMPTNEEAFSKLIVITIDRCDKLIHLFDLSLLKSCPSQLEKITVKECAKIQFIVVGEDDNNYDIVTLSRSLDKLSSFCVGSSSNVLLSGEKTHCDAVSYSYSSLKEVSICGCPQLRTFCQYLLSSEQDSAADHLPFFSQKEIFPCLESLTFSNLSKLVEIWPHQIPPQCSFKMLTKVTIDRCRELSVVFPSTLIPRLDNLTDIKVQHCDQMRKIIIVKEEDGIATPVFSFPCLTTLILEDLLKLDMFYSSSSSSSACGFEFPSLETLEIKGCSEVKTLFSQRRQPTCLVDDHDSDMAGALFRYCDMISLAIPNLKSIKLSDFENLTSIWKGETPEEGLILKLECLSLLGCSFSFRDFESLLPVGVASNCSFYNGLTELYIGCCDGLRDLLTPVVATSLVHLTRLTVESCFSIECVLVATGNEKEDQITFRYLKELRLHTLPNLRKFSSVNNVVLNFPSLEILDIRKCPDMKTFSSGIATASTHKFGDLNSFIQKNIENIGEPCYDDFPRDFQSYYWL